jgi:carboxymethylenebutenolidase
MSSSSAGSGYVVLPEGTPSKGQASGPGVLVLHAWWGLTPFFKKVCDRLAEAGFVALAPDLFFGRTTNDPEEAKARLETADMDATLHLVRSSLITLRSMPATPDAPVGVLGFSMGASWALLMAARHPELVGAATVFYGTQEIDMAATEAPILGHFAEHDELVAEDDVALMEADLKLLEKDVTIHHYPGTGHWFFETDQPSYHPVAAELAWDRTLSFFHQHLNGDAGGS